MKILLSLSYYSPNISGLTIYAKNLANELVKKNHQVTILTSKHREELPESEKKNGLYIERVPITWKVGKGPLMLTFPFRAYTLVKECDVVNCHLPQFESFLIAILAKILHKKVVLTYHTGLAWEGGIASKVIKIFLLGSHTISAVLADTIISYTKDYADNSFFLHFFKNKIVYILPPIPKPEISSKVKDTLQEKIEKIKYKIGVAARLAPEKGFEYVFSAIPLLQKMIGDNFIILIAGPKNPIGEKTYYKKITPLIKMYKEHILFLGSLSSEEIGSFYSLIDVLILPSINRTETFGLVQVEAMLCGTPVIASNLPGVRVPILKTGMGKIVAKKDSKALAGAIYEVLTNKKIYLKSLVKIQSFFLMKKTIKAYEDVFS